MPKKKKPSPKQTFSNKIIRGTYVRSLALALMLLATSSAIILTEQRQDLSSSANNSQPASIIIDPNTDQLARNSNETVNLWLRLDREMTLDVIQLDLTVSGIDDSRLQFQTNELIPGADSVIQNSGGNFKVAYVSEQADRPFVLPAGDLINVGRLRVNTPNSGRVTLSFNDANTDVFESGSSSDKISPISTVSYRVGQGNQNDIALTHVTLVDTQTGETIKTLTGNDTLNSADYPEVTVEAFATNATESIAFEWNNSRVVESVSGYILTGGDDPQGADSWDLDSGQIQLRVTPYERDQAEGDVGPAEVFTLNVTDESDPWEIEEFRLVDTRNNNQVIQTFTESASVDVSDYPEFTLQAVASDLTESVRFDLNGTARIENHYPYIFTGNNDNDLNPWDLGTGEFTIKATPYSRDRTEGEAGLSQTIRLTVTNDNQAQSQSNSFFSLFSNSGSDSRGGRTANTESPNIQAMQFVLVDADNGEDIKVLSNNETISKSQYGNINIRINNFPSSTDSISFRTPDKLRTEQDAPYMLAGDFLGRIYRWRPDEGRTTIEATAYSQDNARGTELGSASITLEIVE